jgi:hypothetical protein
VNCPAGGSPARTETGSPRAKYLEHFSRALPGSHGRRNTLSMRPRLFGAGLMTALVAALVACTAPPTPAGKPTKKPSARPSTTVGPGELVVRLLVRQEGDEEPQFCMGGVNSSYPPGCAGPTIHGWDWDEVDGERRSANVIWGYFEARGIWDGTSFTVGKPPPQSFTPPTEPPRDRPVDPLLDPRNHGAGTVSRLEQIQRELWESGQPVLSDTRSKTGISSCVCPMTTAPFRHRWITASAQGSSPFETHSGQPV